MSGVSAIIVAVVTTPFAVAFWAWLASFPLHLAVPRGRLLAALSVTVGCAACAAMLLLNSGIPADVQFASLIAFVPSALIVFLYWIGRQRRLSETSHG